MTMQENEKHVIAVWGSPCSGKTTLATNMAIILADSGYMTCVLSAADYGIIQYFLGKPIEKTKGLTAAINSGRHVREALTEARDNLFILEQESNGDAYNMENLTPDLANDIMDELRDMFSYVIVDCTSYKEAILTGTGLVKADKVLTCVPHRASAAAWQIANRQMLEAIAPKLIYVETDLFDGGCSIDQLLESVGLPECDLRLPIVKSAFLCENTSQPIVLTNGKMEKKYKEGVLNIVRAILQMKEGQQSAGGKKKRTAASSGIPDERPAKKKAWKAAKDNTAKRPLNIPMMQNVPPQSRTAQTSAQNSWPQTQTQSGPYSPVQQREQQITPSVGTQVPPDWQQPQDPVVQQPPEPNGWNHPQYRQPVQQSYSPSTQPRPGTPMWQQEPQWQQPQVPPAMHQMPQQNGQPGYPVNSQQPQQWEQRQQQTAPPKK